MLPRRTTLLPKRAGVAQRRRSRCWRRPASPTCCVRAPRVRLVRARAGGDAVIDAAIACVADAHRVACGGVAVAARAGASLASALADAAVDAVIVVGGTGSGAQRCQRAHARARRAASRCTGIALLPGETAAFGLRRRRGRCWLLPGRPRCRARGLASSRAGCMLARLARQRGRAAPADAKLTHKVASTARACGTRAGAPARRLWPNRIASGYVPLAALAQADGWILMPPDSEGYPAGSRGRGKTLAMTARVRTEIRPSRDACRSLAAIRRAARQEQFLEVVSAEEARARFARHHRSRRRCPARPSRSAAALGRVLAHDVTRADRRAAVRPRQCRWLRAARRRHRGRERRGAAPASRSTAR